MTKTQSLNATVVKAILEPDRNVEKLFSLYSFKYFLIGNQISMLLNDYYIEYIKFMHDIEIKL